jgi:uncharacterized SAM-binding protein YcdF (DUF218 family)
MKYIVLAVSLIKDMRRCIRKIGFCLLAAVLSWCIILGLIVWRYGANDRATKSDCIIVLGAAVQGTTASPVFEERVRHGIDLYRAGQAPKLLFTGGIGDGQAHSESSVGRSLAIQQGIPATDILCEEKSRTTKQNLSEARVVMRQNGLTSAIIVSDPLHMKRAMLMADDLAIAAASSPTPTSRYRSLKSKLGFLLRELYFIHHYVATGD